MLQSEDPGIAECPILLVGRREAIFEYARGEGKALAQMRTIRCGKKVDLRSYGLLEIENDSCSMWRHLPWRYVIELSL